MGEQEQEQVIKSPWIIYYRQRPSVQSEEGHAAAYNLHRQEMDPHVGRKDEAKMRHQRLVVVTVAKDGESVVPSSVWGRMIR